MRSTMKYVEKFSYKLYKLYIMKSLISLARKVAQIQTCGYNIFYTLYE